MKILTENYQMFVHLGICPSDKPINRWIKWLNKFISIFCFTVFSIGIIAGIAFMKKNFSIDLSNTICAFFPIIALMTGLYLLIAAHVKRNEITAVFDAFQTFYDANKHLDPLKYMARSDQQGANIVQFIIKYFLGLAPASILLMSFGDAVYNKWKYGQIDSQKLYRPFRLVLPWNQHILWGWIAEIFLSPFFPAATVLITQTFATFFVSICIYHEAFHKMFQIQIFKVNAVTHPLSIIRVKKRLHDSILFHVSTKILFEQTADTFSIFVLVQLIGTMVTLACGTFQLDLAIHNLSIEIFFMLFAVADCLLIMYLYCYFGKSTTDFYLKNGDCLYESNWTVLPIKLQKNYIIMIAHAQKPLFYHGFGLVNLHLGIFLKMIKTVYGYYMMFKTLTDD